MVEKDSENFYSKYLRISLPFLVLIFLSFSVFALTTQDANYSGGIYNGGFEFAPTYVADQNQSNFINGTQSGATLDTNQYRWRGNLSQGVEGLIKYNSEIKHSGNYSIDINVYAITSINSSGNITPGAVMLNTTPNETIPQQSKYLLAIKPNTKYKFSWWMKTDSISNVNARGATTALIQFTSNYTYIPTYVTTGYTRGTTDWTYYSYTFTSSATAGYLNFYLWLSGETGRVWFDDVVLEEVGSVNLGGQLQGRPSIVVTGVSDNAIDQADTNNSTSRTFGDISTRQAVGQCFTPTQNKFNGIIFQKGNTVGTFTGDVIISIRDENTLKINTPLSTILTSVTIPNATWNAIPLGIDYNVELPLTIYTNGTKRYCFDFNSTTNDVNNYVKILSDSAVGYSGGTVNYYDGSVWTSQNQDLYFKTLFEKQSSSFDLNVCSSGDSVCESKTYDIDFLENNENYVIAPADAPLFYSGDNNVYFMMHSDSDFNNKTPSMMAKLEYTFDKPTTLLTNTPSTEDNKRIITLTCQNAVTGNCINTYYSTDGVNYTTYTTPLTLTLGTTTLRYYSTSDNNNVETINTTNITIPAQNGTTTCSLISIIPLLIVLVSIMLILGGGAMMTDQAPAAIIQIVLLMVTILITVYVLITSTCLV